MVETSSKRRKPSAGSRPAPAELSFGLKLIRQRIARLWPAFQKDLVRTDPDFFL